MLGADDFRGSWKVEGRWQGERGREFLLQDESELPIKTEQ